MMSLSGDCSHVGRNDSRYIPLHMTTIHECIHRRTCAHTQVHYYMLYSNNHIAKSRHPSCSACQRFTIVHSKKSTHHRKKVSPSFSNKPNNDFKTLCCTVPLNQSYLIRIKNDADQCIGVDICVVRLFYLLTSSASIASTPGIR